jgi:hypothetical protein
LVAACLTLIRHWINEGCPEWRGKPLPSFEEWSRVMGGLLQTIGVDGFLQNLDMTADASSSDEGDWPDFIGGWFDTFGSKPRLSGNPFVSNALGKEAGEFDGSASLLSFVEENGWAIPIKGETPSQRKASLDTLLGYKKGHVFKHNGRSLRLVASGRGTGNKQHWWVEVVTADIFGKAAGEIFLAHPVERDEDCGVDRWDGYHDAGERRAYAILERRLAERDDRTRERVAAMNPLEKAALATRLAEREALR